jgi:hypothetical protein
MQAIDIAGSTRVALVTGVWESTDPGSGAQIASALSLFIGDELRHGSSALAEQPALIEVAFADGEVPRAYGMVDRWLARDVQRGALAMSDESKPGT